MDKNKRKGNLMLLLAAAIWGSAFVAQRVGMDVVGPFTFNAVRNVIGPLVLLPVILYNDRKNGQPLVPKDPKERRDLLLGGVLCGAALFVASSLQQMGLVETDAGKAGFITSLYIVVVPILSLLLGRRPSAAVWVAVVPAVAGLYLLCGGSLALNRYDALLLGCALCFAVQILVVDHFSPKVSGPKLAALQFLTCAVLSTPVALATEEVSLAAIGAAWMPIAYAGVLSSGVAYTLQVVAQKCADPTVASILMSLESLFSVLAGWLILREQLSGTQLLGCALMFLAVMLTELPIGKWLAKRQKV